MSRRKGGEMGDTVYLMEQDINVIIAPGGVTILIGSYGDGAGRED